MPLIDMTPSGPTTMRTGMTEAQKLTWECGQTFTVFTDDQQMYMVMVNVIWSYPEQLTTFIPRLGGMHFLMSFIGSIRSLMTNLGLEDILKAELGGVSYMLSGKHKQDC